MDLNPKQILALADSHIEHFDRLVKMAKAADVADRVKRTINVGDCLHYKSVWGSIKAKGGIWKDLSRQERGEIADAVLSGEYTTLLGDVK